MNFLLQQVTFQEVPGEISLSFLISGCQLRCLGCHSPDCWNDKNGVRLDPEYFLEQLKLNRKYISCVLFLGGEWAKEELIQLLKIAAGMKLKTALYTGLEYADLDKDLLENLNFLKTGPYVKSLGGLSNPKTNQRFIKLKTMEVLNHKFQTKEGDSDQIEQSTIR